MGSLASPIAPHPIMEEHQNKRLHPFFTGERDKPPAAPHDLRAPIPTEAPLEPTPTHVERSAAAPGEGPQKSDRPQKRRKTDSGDDAADKGEQRVRRKATESPDGTALAQITPNNQDGTTAGVPSNIPSAAPGLPRPTNPSLSESAAAPYMTPEETPTNQPDSSSDPSKAKKLIKFNPKTGTLGPPPRPKVPTKTTSKGSAKGRKSFLVCIKYGGSDPDARERMGKHIKEILERKQGQAKPGTPSNPPNQPSTTTSKRPHPFFSKKSKKSPTSETTPSTPKAAGREKPARQVVFSSTPCSPKRSRVAASGNGPQFGVKSTGLKVPGACLPPWPPQDMAHVRGLEHGPVSCPPLYDESRPQRKLKGHSVEVADEESILTALTRSTDVAAVAASIQSDIDNANDILPPPKELQLPQKHFESGTKVQRRMRSRLVTYHAPSHTSDSSEDELGPQVHPIIKRLFNSLGPSLSSYDRSTCESSSWAHKYAPQTTAEILQPGKEGSLLREWLLSLKINSVDTGADSAGEKAADAKARGKKKRKRALEGFIVDSDDEADELDEVSEGEEAWASQSDMGSLRSVIRHGDTKAKARDGRLTNAVVISGPHGCGKTAAVYAIAKELDYEIFEINASSRRNGKDVLERVGDMTRNHLVHHQADEAEDQTVEEVKSGKQGTMTSFFKPNSGGTAQKAKPASPKTSPKASGTKHQKQSLILLEEVDILYEEDKQFWATITSLIAQSKRPFVMTCNDEALVPFQMLNLHGIFRFNPPPTDLAVDVMLLAAASEGHVLERRPVEELYETRGRDLRAALTELNYWCQLGVGDRRGGMDWFYLRWPAGSDRDENGNVVRVISEGTYQSGMGWFGDAASWGEEEELVRESWDAWGVDCDGPLVDGPRGTVAGWSDFVDAMSAADVLSRGALAQRHEERLDATLPETSARARDDYILGRTLLDAPQLTTYSPLASAASTAVKCLARKRLDPPPPRLTEKEAISNIRATLTAPSPLTRPDLSLAFDPIAASDKVSASGHLDPSVFDRTMRLIVLDVAPFVRGVVAADERRRRERSRAGSLLVSEGGKRRKTRAAMSAAEGGERRATRGERYFSGEVNGWLVRRTGGRWEGALEEAMRGQEEVLSEGGAMREQVEDAMRGQVEYAMRGQAEDAVRGQVGGVVEEMRDAC